MRPEAKKELDTMFDVLENPDNYPKEDRMKYARMAIDLINRLPDPVIDEYQNPTCGGCGKEGVVGLCPNCLAACRIAS